MRSDSVLACSLFSCLLLIPAFAGLMQTQTPPPEPVQVAPPLRRAEPPAPNASAQELERQGDDLRASKFYLDAIDYYTTALAKKPGNATVLNKLGITELLLQRYHDAKKHFERSIKGDRKFADAYNNLGVVEYLQKNYSRAIKRYDQAIELRDDSASYYSNLGAAYFSKKDFEKAFVAYGHAMQLDPEVFERTSHAGVSAQMSKPEDRAHYDYVLAKLYAKMGQSERSLRSLRRAMEEGYKGIENVYKDTEFSELRKDPRFASLMAAKPPAIPD